MSKLPADRTLDPIGSQSDLSTLRSQRRRAGLKLVCFRVEGEHYAVSIERVKRITDLSGAYGLLSTGNSLMDSNGENITLINLHALVHGSAQPRLQASQNSAHNAAPQPYVIVCYTANRQLMGIAVEQMPAIHAVPEAALQPLPDLYRQSLSSDCVKALVRLPSALAGQPDLLYLNLDRLG
ncbi:chemotaxis protein CheW [Leptolyngbya sp. FACHB-261]|uniref:chemotaxis protein CheW n=1 Tax=Leptolyngbya sp. FACHB-261 TaxID=2692806 RepID=UPI0016820448|nr:chemotaxis protein CheW [Leptolyngbya sp. FACHB-261]MBD2104027.1 CheW domain-containing protein [Leptolyngbya sp. FACHB-261]